MNNETSNNDQLESWLRALGQQLTAKEEQKAIEQAERVQKEKEAKKIESKK